MPRPAAAPPLAALAAAASLAAAPPAAGAGEPVGADWSLSAAFLSEAPPLTDDPAPRVAVRAPRNAAERATFAEALAWWSAESNEEVKEADPAALTWWAADGAGATAGGVRPASAAGLAAGPAAVAALAWWSPQEEEQEEEEADRGDDPAPADDADAEEDATDAEADAAEADAAEADAAEADAAAESTEAEALPAICVTLPCAFAPLSEIGAGLNDPTAVLAATVRVETVRDASGGECERRVPVAYREIAPPEDLGRGLLRGGGGRGRHAVRGPPADAGAAVLLPAPPAVLRGPEPGAVRRLDRAVHATAGQRGALLRHDPAAAVVGRDAAGPRAGPRHAVLPARPAVRRRDELPSPARTGRRPRRGRRGGGVDPGAAVRAGAPGVRRTARDPGRGGRRHSPFRYFPNQA